MDSVSSYYPEELLVGFFPLVFAVNAIYDDSNESTSNNSNNNSNDNKNDNDNNNVFDQFLNAISASLIDESDETNSSTDNSSTRRTSRGTLSMFRPDDNTTTNELLESSDDEDDILLLDHAIGRTGNKRGSGGSGGGGGGTFNYYSGFTTTTTTTPATNSRSSETSYAKALKHGGGRQAFFQRARIVSVSNKYGFPPSKDPEGTQNLSYELSTICNKYRGRTANSVNNNIEKEIEIKALLQHYPIYGILSSSWLEKHIHALPSVIMVICTVSNNQKEQYEQDKYLFHTFEHLQYSLVPKRQCSVQIIGLLKNDGITLEQGNEWKQSIIQDLVLEENSNTPFAVSLLRIAEDLQQKSNNNNDNNNNNNNTVTTSSALKQLHKTVRDSSLTYYLRQARRTKEKLIQFINDITGSNNNTKRKYHHHNSMLQQPPMELSPLLIRYCFKIAIFYEFQIKYEKSLLYIAEAYKYISKYYQWLLKKKQQQSTITESSSNNEKSKSSLEQQHNTSPKVATGLTTTGETGVEVELKSAISTESADTGGISWSKVVPAPPDDILYQCRAVADWLNMKLLSSGFASHTEGGLLAASNQWRQHCRIFATRRYTDYLYNMEDWYEWTYILRQRLVMSQLVEKHPPTALGDIGNEYDEVVLRCSPWRSYVSTAEAMLRVGIEIQKMKNSGKYDNIMDDISQRSDIARARYVGGISSTNNEGLILEFHEQCNINHQEKAYEYITKAITMYEHELEKDKRGFYAEDEYNEHSSSRTGARLYYLAGGILLKMQQHENAVTQLTKALHYSKGWSELELSVRRMLIECYEKHIPSQIDNNKNNNNTTTENSQQALVSLILDSYFNAEMSSEDLRRALDHFATISGGNSLKWYHETQEEEDPSLPFSFAVNFPGKTHATSGDTVEASVVIKSHLDYAVQVNTVALGTLAGKLPIPPNDLLSATNASEGAEGGIIIQSKTSIIVTTRLELPKDLSAIAADESGNGGELLGIAGKGSFAKNAKPRSAGITSAGGARLVSEEKLSPGNSNSQGWNLRYLGGKPLLCDGLHISFYPVQVERISGGGVDVTMIDLTIEKKKKKTAANIKRTPFEEENYIASAWSRPQHVPFMRGPRSLRVLGPQPELVITNLTEHETGGKALEGTVNRVLLKFQAGPEEICSNIKINVSCFSVLITPTGTTKRLIQQKDDDNEVEDSLDMRNPVFRTPILVKPSSASSDEMSSTEYGYQLPSGWQAAGTGQRGEVVHLPALRNGESSFVPIEFFRPSTRKHGDETPIGEGSDDVELGELSMCKTDFYVTVTYKQERPIARKSIQSRRRSTRRRPVKTPAPKESNAATDESPTIKKQCEDKDNEISDEVSLEYNGSVVWIQPMSASFNVGSRKGFSSGSRHPSNRCDVSKQDPNEIVLIDGESVSLRCLLHLDSSMQGLAAEIHSIRFENEATSPLNLSLLSDSSFGPADTIFRRNREDRGTTLSEGSRFKASFSISTSLKDEYKKGGVSSHLGTVLVDWKPRPLEFSDDVDSPDFIDGKPKAHGPLALDTVSTTRFSGPSSYIERAPFEARYEYPNSPVHMSIPFCVNYSLQNMTDLHQTLNIRFLDNFGDDKKQESNAFKSGLLLSGPSLSTLTLSPKEKFSLPITVIATRSGEIVLPPLQISSERYSSWIIEEGSVIKKIVVLP